MNQGVYPSNIQCSFCNRYCVDVDATWYEGLPHHERCFKMYLLTEIRKYEKKVALGTITLAEGHRLKEFHDMYEVERRSPPTIPVSKMINPETPRFIGNTSLSISSINRLAIEGRDALKLASGSTEKIPLISDGKNEENVLKVET